MASEPREEVPPSKLFAPVLPYQSGSYMTVFNIIQALALGFWANELHEVLVKNDLTLALILRSAVALVIILLIWHHSSELQYLWPLSWRDTTNPFVIGVLEFSITFCVNPKAASLKLFVMAIAGLQIAGSLAYLGNYAQRKKVLTEKVYQEFYREYPQFKDHLVSFLKRYDLKQVLDYSASVGISLIFFALTIFLPWQGYDIVFPLFCIIYFTVGETVGNFQAEQRKDPLLRSYFQ